MLSLSLKWHRCCSIADTCKVCCAKGFRFSSHLGDFHFDSNGCTFHSIIGPLFLYFFKTFQTIGLVVKVSIRLVLRLWLQLGFRFTFYTTFLPNLTALSSCVTVTLQVGYLRFQISGSSRQV